MTGKLGHVQKLDLLRRVIQSATGQDVPTRALIESLSSHLHGSLHLTAGMVRHLQEGQAQQDAINASVRLTMRVRGVQTPYAQAYELYVERIEAAGHRPLDLKTFRNRALAEYRPEPENITPLRIRKPMEAAG